MLLCAVIDLIDFGYGVLLCFFYSDYLENKLHLGMNAINYLVG